MGSELEEVGKNWITSNRFLFFHCLKKMFSDTEESG